MNDEKDLSSRHLFICAQNFKISPQNRLAQFLPSPLSPLRRPPHSHSTLPLHIHIKRHGRGLVLIGGNSNSNKQKQRHHKTYTGRSNHSAAITKNYIIMDDHEDDDDDTVVGNCLHCNAPPPPRSSEDDPDSAAATRVQVSCDDCRSFICDGACVYYHMPFLTIFVSCVQ